VQLFVVVYSIFLAAFQHLQQHYARIAHKKAPQDRLIIDQVQLEFAEDAVEL